MPTWQIRVTIILIETQERGTLHVHPFHPDINQIIVNIVMSNLRAFTYHTRSLQQFNTTRTPIFLSVFVRRIRIDDNAPEITESEDDRAFHSETYE